MTTDAELEAAAIRKDIALGHMQAAGELLNAAKARGLPDVHAYVQNFNHFQNEYEHAIRDERRLRTFRRLEEDGATFDVPAHAQRST